MAYVEESLQTHQPVAAMAGQKPWEPSGSALCWHPNPAGALSLGADVAVAVSLGTGSPVVEASVGAGNELEAAVLAARRPVPTTVEIGSAKVMSAPSSLTTPEGAPEAIDRV